MLTKEKIQEHPGYKFLLTISNAQYILQEQQSGVIDLQKTFEECGGTEFWARGVLDLLEESGCVDMWMAFANNIPKEWERRVSGQQYCHARRASAFSVVLAHIHSTYN